jgi:hypothetical protein
MTLPMLFTSNNYLKLMVGIELSIFAHICQLYCLYGFIDMFLLGNLVHR